MGDNKKDKLYNIVILVSVLVLGAILFIKNDKIMTLSITLIFIVLFLILPVIEFYEDVKNENFSIPKIIEYVCKVILAIYSIIVCYFMLVVDIIKFQNNINFIQCFFYFFIFILIMDFMKEIIHLFRVILGKADNENFKKILKKIFSKGFSFIIFIYSIKLTVFDFSSVNNKISNINHIMNIKEISMAVEEEKRKDRIETIDNLLGFDKNTEYVLSSSNDKQYAIIQKFEQAMENMKLKGMNASEILRYEIDKEKYIELYISNNHGSIKSEKYVLYELEILENGYVFAAVSYPNDRGHSKHFKLVHKNNEPIILNSNELEKLKNNTGLELKKILEQLIEQCDDLP